MTDPIGTLSNVAGVISLLCDIGSTVISYVQAYNEVPESAQQVIEDIDVMKLVYQKIQFIIAPENDEQPSPIQTSFPELERTFKNSVKTLTDLQQMVNKATGKSLAPGTSSIIGKIGKVKWVWYEKDILKILSRMQKNKENLNLILTCSCEINR